MMIIFVFLNNRPIIMAMTKKATIIELIKLSIKNLLPFMKVMVVPVTARVILVSAKRDSILGLMTPVIRESILFDPISATLSEILIFCLLSSTKFLERPASSGCKAKYLRMKPKSRLLGRS